MRVRGTRRRRRPHAVFEFLRRFAVHIRHLFRRDDSCQQIQKRIFIVASCCRNNCFFNSYADVLDLFGEGSHEDDARDSSEKLTLDGGKAPERDETLFGPEVGTEGKLEDEGFSATTTDFLLGI